MMLAGTLGLALVQVPVRAQETNKPSPFKDDKEKASYGLGLNVGSFIKANAMDMDVDILAGAIKDVLAGRELKMTDQQAMEAVRNYQTEGRKKLAEKNKKDGDAFLAENKKKEGVKTQMVTLQDGTQGELQYKVITEGTGELPKSNDVVVVKYRGTLPSGKEFDNSSRRPGPTKLSLAHDIRGRAAALAMMKIGSKWEVYMPAALAYGDRGPEPGSPLIFELELVGVDNPPPQPVKAAQPQAPLTSDIIRVPSAEELKKGAKVEVLKQEDVDKQIKAAGATNPPADKKD